MVCKLWLVKTLISWKSLELIKQMVRKLNMVLLMDGNSEHVELVQNIQSFKSIFFYFSTDVGLKKMP